MSGSKTDQEPTMEEILASIRRIISEDSGEGEGPAPTPPPRHPAGDVLELTEEMVADDSAGAAVAAPPPEAEAPAAAEPVAEPSVAAAELVEAAVSTRVSDAFAALASAVNADREVPLDGAGGRSLEQLVTELLRPMLKDWLDRNLPPLVERLVAAEIARLSSRSDDR